MGSSSSRAKRAQPVKPDSLGSQTTDQETLKTSSNSSMATGNDTSNNSPSQKLRNRVRLKIHALGAFANNLPKSLALFYQPHANRTELSEFVASLRRQSIQDWNEVTGGNASCGRFSVMPGSIKEDAAPISSPLTTKGGVPLTVYIDMTKVRFYFFWCMIILVLVKQLKL